MMKKIKECVREGTGLTQPLQTAAVLSYCPPQHFLLEEGEN